MYIDNLFIPLDEHGLGNVVGSRIFSPNNDLCIVERLLRHPNILGAYLYDLLIALTTTKDQSQDTFIFTNSLNSIFLINNHIHQPLSQHNHLDKLLILAIAHQILWTKYNITIQNIKVHIGMKSNEIVDQLTNKRTTRNKLLPTPHIDITQHNNTKFWYTQYMGNH